jgi:hypothetical protein
MGICQYTGAPFCMRPEAQICLGTALKIRLLYCTLRLYTRHAAPMLVKCGPRTIDNLKKKLRFKLYENILYLYNRYEIGYKRIKKFSTAARSQPICRQKYTVRPASSFQFDMPALHSDVLMKFLMKEN